MALLYLLNCPLSNKPLVYKTLNKIRSVKYKKFLRMDSNEWLLEIKDENEFRSGESEPPAK